MTTITTIIQQANNERLKSIITMTNDKNLELIENTVVITDTENTPEDFIHNDLMNIIQRTDSSLRILALQEEHLNEKTSNFLNNKLNDYYEKVKNSPLNSNHENISLIKELRNVAMKVHNEHENNEIVNQDTEDNEV